MAGGLQVIDSLLEGRLLKDRLLEDRLLKGGPRQAAKSEKLAAPTRGESASSVCGVDAGFGASRGALIWVLSFCIFGVCVFGVILPRVSLALDQAGSKRIAQALEREVKRSRINRDQLGLWVGRSDQSGQPEALFGLNASREMIPASVSKLATAQAVLKRFPQGYKFSTQLRAAGLVDGQGVLQGDLYLVGGGDPSFVSETMWFLVNELARTGIRRVSGRLVVDDSLFDRQRIDEDRSSVRVDRAYDAPVGAMSMNWNSYSIYVRPGLKVGDPCVVVVDVATPLVRLSNKCVTRAKGSLNLRDTVRVEKEALVKASELDKWSTGLKAGEPNTPLDQIDVSGSAAMGADEWVAYKNATHPEWTALANLAGFLEQRGIRVDGKWASEAAPDSARVLAKAESKPISGVVGDMNKWSSNYVAEMLTKGLAVISQGERIQRPGDMRAGLDVVRGVLRENGVSEKQFTFLNPAGFSRENRVAASTLGSLLVSWQADFRTYPELVASLPTAGIDGTLRSRFQGSPARGWVRAKTGLLNGVVGLAGYAGRADGTVLSFAFLFNGPADREDEARQLFDRAAGVVSLTN